MRPGCLSSTKHKYYYQHNRALWIYKDKPVSLSLSSSWTTRTVKHVQLLLLLFWPSCLMCLLLSKWCLFTNLAKMNTQLLFSFSFFYALCHIRVCLALVRSMKYLMESPAYLLNASCSLNCREYTVIIETPIVLNCKENKMDEALFFRVHCSYRKCFSDDVVISLQFVDFRVIFAHL